MSNMNEPAFPIIDEAPGLTKLEWAAIQIVAGMWANPNLVVICDDPTYAYVSNGAALAARALFAELEKQG